MKKPASRRQVVKTDIGSIKGTIELRPGAVPYLWVGLDGQCAGCVPDNQVGKLKDMCTEILNRRLLEK